MSDVIKIKKGLNIKLKGQADKIFVKAPRSKTYSVKPVDFQKFTKAIEQIGLYWLLMNEALVQ